MVASQSGATEATPPNGGGAHHNVPLNHNHHHHQPPPSVAEMYGVHPPPYGDYFHDYYMHAAAHHHHPHEMCPAHHLCHIQGEFGPVTVPMVSTNSSPPIAMPVQVPPGHMVQQIVDESGTLRHVILSPQHPPNMMPLPSHNPQHFSSGPQGGTNQSQYYTTTGGGAFSPGPPGSGQPPHFHGGMPPPGGGTAGGGGGVPSPTHQGHSPPPPSQTVVPPPAYFRDERAHRQHIKLRRKLNEKQKNNNSTEKSDAIIRKDFVNGLKRSSEGKEKGMNSVGTSEDGEESSVPDEEDPYPAVIDVLSSVQAPKVSELTSRSALLQWAPPIRLSETASSDSHDLDIQESDLRYEVLLSDKSKEMKFKSIYSGTSLSCASGQTARLRHGPGPLLHPTLRAGPTPAPQDPASHQKLPAATVERGERQRRSGAPLRAGVQRRQQSGRRQRRVGGVLQGAGQDAHAAEAATGHRVHLQDGCRQRVYWRRAFTV
ncbi:unnamed protein product [Callosobruchus maculatus]|uniref:Fibronectin type-III domain-containing protein n=1 Tax=Callosobruchus maculatus TaxID=64391 RepID=A0A653DWB2_CALMS|nr:unnamed protein product [Callosobruchus maculatus]